MKESQYRFRVWDDFWKEMHYFDFCTNIEVRNGCLWVVHSEGAICLDYVPPIVIIIILAIASFPIWYELF